MSPALTLPATIVFAAEDTVLPAYLTAWLGQSRSAVSLLQSGDDLMAVALRGRPALVVFDARTDFEAALDACARMKRDSYTGVVPAFVLSSGAAENVTRCFDAGADEVVDESAPAHVSERRLDAMLIRSGRDLGVQPSTRLPGAAAIESDIMRRMALPDLFAVCYADLDHFKEYNDRYSYNEGDRVIRMLATLLHDVAKGLCGERAFVGHIGGDDFIFIIPYDDIADVCDEIVSTFDLLVPYQYSEHDRRAGYFFGKDRRGVLDRVPLMTLSIGVVTNAQRVFTAARQVSRLATEMKTYAKTLSGSVYSIDRRTDDRLPAFETDRNILPEVGGRE